MRQKNERVSGTLPPKKALSVETNDIVLPGDTNKYNTLFGGRLMEMVDKAAAICSARYCHEEVVTASIEAVDFHIPIKEGYFVRITATLIFTGTSSMLVRVRVLGEEPVTGKSEHCCTAYVTMVAIDTGGKPKAVPPLLVETEEEKLDREEGYRIRESTQKRRKGMGETHSEKRFG
ncbi:MAG: acyl-CoA thioesterase [Spirochaetales bacterium]|nr:acyl-CoA thioesterase [Spirochaetales bacterium]